MRFIISIIWIIFLYSVPTSVMAQDLLRQLFSGSAHFAQIGTLDWGARPYSNPQEQGGWFSVVGNDWYVFNRNQITQPATGCRQDHTAVIVRVSHDQGKHWSNPPAIAVLPGTSRTGDGCAILDGSTYFTPQTATWDMIVQCLDKESKGGWALCHYSRKALTPLGPFVADPANPVVRGNQLWSQICAGGGKACDPLLTRDEGTPDIVEKRGAYFYVTFHGFDYQSKHSYRGIAKTTDFHTWITNSADLPNDAILAPANCQTWSNGCVGVGETSSITSGGYHYILAEAPNKSLTCTDGQDWVFGLARAPVGLWPRWNSGQWAIATRPLLQEAWPSPSTRCGLQYARWIKDGENIYIVYEDWGPHRAWVDRRLLKLFPGAGPQVQITPFEPR